MTQRLNYAGYRVKQTKDRGKTKTEENVWLKL